MQEWYADVIIDRAVERLDQIFQYRVPEKMRRGLEAGAVVEVPFGRGDRPTRGYIVGFSSSPGYDPGKIKEIGRVLTDGKGAEEKLIRLAAWMKDYYGCTMSQALRTVLPVKKKTAPREQTLVCLAADRKEAAKMLAQFQKKNQKARARLLQALIEDEQVPWHLLREKLQIEISVRKALEEKGLIRTVSRRIYRSGTGHLASDRGPGGDGLHPGEQGSSEYELNPAQKTAVDTIVREWDRTDLARGYLLLGVTGSGKTAVYLELIEEARRRGQQAIVLIPEISLTYQTLLRFYRRFGQRVGVIHSRLSEGERSDQFDLAGNGELDVMIGPRSALFTPFPNLGIIVIDEEQEPAYASEAMPRYHARETAFERARLENAKVVLGSATPSVEAYYRAEKGELKILELPGRVNDLPLPEVAVADMRQELKSGNRSMFSALLQQEIEKALSRREQVMLFLNRRGYAGFLNCRSCGHVMRCPHCDVSLTLHQDGKNRLMCHYCGYGQDVPKICPQCGSGFLRTFKAGTQQVEEEVIKRFPGARVLRMDMDTTRRKDSHASILSAFSRGEADILIGTQMIVKGHDFPNVTLMGIVAADLSLHVPDYRSSERTFQLLTQAAGRAGRAGKPGKVVIQTYDPEHYSIRMAARQDYRAFFEEEMNFRSLAGYPPAGRLTAVHLSGTDPQHLEKACTYLGKYARDTAAKYHVQVLGPADESIAKIQDVYRKVLYLKGSDRSQVRAVRRMLERYIDCNQGFSSLTVQYEVE